VDKILTLGPLETIAILGLRVVLKGAYSTDILQVWYHSIGIHFILLHVVFEDELSISFWKNRTTCHKNLELKIVKFLKKSNMFKARFISYAAFFKLLCAIGQKA
jgi:hypothetical protein